MTETIHMLRIEHANALELLALLQSELAALQASEASDSDILTGAIEYFSEYPDQCHHPVEDELYKFIQHRNPEAAKHFENLGNEHKRIAKLTTELRALIDETENQERNEQLTEKLKDFIDTYTLHMKLEEKHFFPTALQVLTPADWANLDFEMFDQPDPLFDREKEGRFGTLRQRLMELSEHRAKEREREHEIEKVSALQSAADFNQITDSLVASLTLRPTQSGRYEIVRDDHVLADIPASDERTAAWCAYFYARGLAEK